jgi:ABC-type maltose transport system permease subunit
VAIQQIVGMTITFTEGPFTTYGGEAAAQVLATLPVLIIFILLQRWFVRGLTEGVLKM